MPKLFLRRITFAGFFILCASSALAVDTNQLAEDPEWLALLHINRGATIHSRNESYVDDENFFIAEDGQSDRVAELNASIAAMQPAQSEARCKFPARYRFLARMLQWSEAQPLAHCTEYIEWRDQIPSGRAVLVFPASYLNSPSSMFGHTLLRLDSSAEPESVWSSWAVNFGAVTSEKDNSLLYAYRGLAGGYPGRFVIVPYVTKVQEYSHMENRDIWEYSLSLTDAELARLIDHLWELREINFDYYFFDENCSFRLLELLDVARPGDNIIQGFRFAEAPVNSVRTLYQQDLVSDRVYRPSKAVELQADLDALSGKELRLAKRLFKNPAIAQEEEFQRYAPSRRHLMARVAFRTLRLQERKHARSDDVAARSFALLRIISDNPLDEDIDIATPAPPEDGHGTQMIGLGGGQVGAQDFGELYYRFTYHDLIDNHRGFLQGAQIEALDFRLRSTESDELKLESLDIVHIRSLAPRNRFLKPISWYVQGGLERAVAGGEKRLVRFVQGGAGGSWRWGPMQPYALTTLRLENNSAYDPLMEGGAGANLGVLWYFPHLEMNASVESVYFGNDEYRNRWQVDMNIPLSRQNGLRLEWQRDVWRDDAEQGFNIAWRHYFD